jgi:hypothetical protein
LNCANVEAVFTAKRAATSLEGTLPIQSTAIVCPARLMIGPCAVMFTVSCFVAPPRTGIE